jgi:hypothetical protein
MKLRKLKESGIKIMQEYLDSLSTESPLAYPLHVLTDPSTSDSLGTDIEIEFRQFSSKLDAAKYLDELFVAADIRNIIYDKGLWAWLSLFFFETLCPPAKKGKRKPGEIAKWIPEVDNYLRYYRHLLAGPYRIYNANRDWPERALAFLCVPVYVHGEIMEQLAARQGIITNKSWVEVATTLYYDNKTKVAKRGSSGKGPGTPRKLSRVIKQFDLTFDLYAMTSQQLLELLPSEFDKFKLAS